MTAKYDWHGNEWDYLTGLNPAKLSASRSVLVKHPQERDPSDRLISQRWEFQWIKRTSAVHVEKPHRRDWSNTARLARRDARKTPALHLLLTRWAAIGSSWMARESISNSNTFRGKNSVPPCSVDEILKLVSIGYRRKSRRDTRSFVRNVQEIRLPAWTFRSHFNIFNRRLK